MTQTSSRESPIDHNQKHIGTGIMIAKLSLYVSCALAVVARSGAFTVPSRLNRNHHHAVLPYASTHITVTRRMSENPLDGGELMSTLAGLDREWRAQQLAEGSDSRWSKVVLPSDNYPVSEQAAAYESYQNYVYLLEPRSKKPDYVFFFTGGAGKYCL